MKKDINLQGFTLIELSVVLIIGGVLLVMALQAYQIYSEKQYIDNSRSQLVDIDQYILDFPSMIDPATADPVTGLGGTEYGRLPCPDANNDGLEDCAMATVRGWRPNGTANGPNVMVGGLPYATLGLPLEYAREPSNSNLIVYAVTQNVTQQATFGSSVGAIQVQVYDEDDNLDSTLYTVPYIVVSTGRQVGCGLENCDGDAHFISAYYNSIAESDFDDRVIYRPSAVSGNSSNNTDVLVAAKQGEDFRYLRNDVNGQEVEFLSDGYVHNAWDISLANFGGESKGKQFFEVTKGDVVSKNDYQSNNNVRLKDKDGNDIDIDTKLVDDEFIFATNPGASDTNGNDFSRVLSGGSEGDAGYMSKTFRIYVDK